MSETTLTGAGKRYSGTPLPARYSPRIPVIALGMSLGLFLSLSYVLCIIFDLWFPEYSMYQVWSPFLPGFSWISVPSFFLGLVEAFAYGWYIALVFGPLYNVISRRFDHA